MVSFLLPLISIFFPLFSRWVESRAGAMYSQQASTLILLFSFFWCFKFCPHLQEKGTANGFVFDSALFQAADILSLKDSISMVYQIFSLPAIYGVTEAVFKVTLLQNWQID